MKFLIDTSQNDIERRLPEFGRYIRGQLITPLTGYSDWGHEYAIDNGAFSGFDANKWKRILWRQRSYGKDSLDRCLFVTCPDMVGAAARTMDLWNARHRFISDAIEFEDKMALVAQDGTEFEVHAELFCLLRQYGVNVRADIVTECRTARFDILIYDDRFQPEMIVEVKKQSTRKMLNAELGRQRAQISEYKKFGIPVHVVRGRTEAMNFCADVLGLPIAMSPEDREFSEIIGGR